MDSIFIKAHCSKEKLEEQYGNRSREPTLLLINRHHRRIEFLISIIIIPEFFLAASQRQLLWMEFNLSARYYRKNVSVPRFHSGTAEPAEKGGERLAWACSLYPSPVRRSTPELLPRRNLYLESHFFVLKPRNSFKLKFVYIIISYKA